MGDTASDDLFDDPILGGTPPSGDPPSPPGRTAVSGGQPAPQGAARGEPQGGGQDRMLEVLNSVNAGLANLTSRMDRYERGGQQPPAQPAQPARPSNPSDALTALYNDPEGFISTRVGNVVGEQLKQLVPFFESMADGVTTSATERARSSFDRDFGAGAFDDLVGEELQQALSTLPAASRIKGDYVNALVAGILGGKMQSDDGRKKVGDALRKAREASRPPPPVLLTGSGRVPTPRDTLSDDERTAIASLRRAGIDFSEKAFLDAKGRGDSEEDWGGDWMAKNNYWEPEKPKTPNGGA